LIEATTPSPAPSAAPAPTVDAVPGEPVAEADGDTTSKAQYRRMFNAACGALGLINEALGLDPDDGGAEPILDAITELKSAALAASVAPSAAPHQGADALREASEPLAWHVEYPAGAASYVHVKANELDALELKRKYPDVVVTPLYPLAALTAAPEADALREDAERYRFLAAEAYECVIPHGNKLAGKRTAWITKLHPGESFSKAIDAARAALAQHQAPQQTAPQALASTPPQEAE
jgi:hypothetical protein